MSGYAGDKSSPTVEDTQQNQGLIQIWLIRQGDEVVSNLMQDRFADGELRFELKDTMRQRDHRARDGSRLSRNRQTIPPRAGKRERTAHTREGGKRRQVAVFTFGFAARKLVAHLSGKRHAGLCLRVGARQVAVGDAHVVLSAFQVTGRGLGNGNAAVLAAVQPMAIESCGLPSAI